ASTTPGVVSEANLRMQASGDGSRIVFQTRHGGEGAWRGAAIGLDTPANPAEPTMFWADAQRFAFMDTSSSSTINALVYDSGVWRMNVANIGTVTAGVIKSADDKFIITVSDGKIEWFD